MPRLALFFTLFVLVPSRCSSYSVLTLDNEADRFDAAVERGWQQWGEWQPCSRSCGGGITYMLRHCLRTRNDGETDCVGPNRKYSSCNIQDCPEGSIDFRTQQCSRYNNQSYRGSMYNWTPYIGAPALNPCELHCRSDNDSFIIKLAEKVVDGTRCRPDTDDVCVDGTCQEVGCDKMLGSSFKDDKCMACGGDGSSCYRVHGVFNTPNPPEGYSQIVVIPIGATSIEIDEHKATRNHLAVRNALGDYVLNRNPNFNGSRAIQVAGTTLNYYKKLSRRRAPESLHASGPTTEKLYVDLVVQEKNRGVKYNFYLPIGTNDPNRENIEWVPGKWSQCTRDCGGGTQSRQLACYKDEVKVSSYVCKLIQRPQKRQQCNLDPCRARWYSSNWTECSASCAGGIRFRQVFCTETPASSHSLPRLIPDRRCDEEDNSLRPPSQGICEEHPCPSWVAGNWTECSTSCGAGLQQRRVTCTSALSCSSIPTPESIRECHLGPCTGLEWVVSEWGLCTERCGTGMQTRQVYCTSKEGITYDDKLCRNFPRPASQRTCHSRSECTVALRWMTGDWSKCSADCGSGIQTRKVVCSHLREATYRTFPDDLCESRGEKPATTRDCFKPECQSTWFTGSWQPCSSSCGGGRRTRHVMCPVKINNQVPACDANTKPTSEESCNVEACPRLEPDEIVASIVGPGDPAYVECSLTLYGCCLDNRTPAQDWLMKGCDDVNPTTIQTSACHSSRFGCCRDGVRTATGPSQYGCPEYDACYVASDLGQLCGERWLARYYYDSEMSRCNFFWYGGCGGNRNNHVSKERCLQVCDTRETANRGRSDTRSSFSRTTSAAAATEEARPPTTSSSTANTPRPVLPTGPTRPTPALSFIPNPTLATRQSELVESTRSLLLPALPKSTESIWVGRRLSGSECSLPPSTGRCSRRILRWYFEPLQRLCKTFTFSGCERNPNNFVTRIECQLACDGNDRVETATATPRVQTQCELKRLEASAEGKRSPQCDESNGKYRLLQCISDYNGVASWCWCVDPDSGNEIDGTRRYGSITPDCKELTRPFTSSTPRCAHSRYGCCPDDVTPVRGRRRTGCRESVHIRPSRTLVAVRRGDSASLPCPAHGRPKPTVRWFKDGQEIVSNSRTRSSVRVDHTRHSLIFTSVQPQDVGNYACEASNGVGLPQRRNIRLSLLDESLRFRVRPTNVTVNEGEDAVLKCRVRGRRVPIAWFKNGRPQRMSNYVTISRLGDLQIAKSITSDSGKYTCYATSQEEEISASAYITVNSRRTTTSAPPSTTTTLPSTTEHCIDMSDLANCDLVAKANMCAEEVYGQICCFTCRRYRRRHAVSSRRRLPNRL